MFPAWTWIVGFVIGAFIGSFLNVIIYRLPRGLSIYRPVTNYCPSCKHKLGWLDLFPIFSWLSLKGKCRYCRAKVPARYVVVELITATLWAVIWYQIFFVRSDPLATDQLSYGVATAYAIAYALFASALVVAIFTDLAHYIIPDQVNGAMLVIGLGLNVALIFLARPEAWLWEIPSSIAGALVGWAALWGIAFFGRLLLKRDSMGHGDIKMARGIGSVLLPAASLMSFAVAVVLGAVLGIVAILVRRSKDSDQMVEDPPQEAESLKSLLQCGLGYILCIDIIGLFYPKMYERWFGENPYAIEEIEDEPVVELTTIPFGPYLAAGALVALLANDWLMGLWRAYVKQLGP